MAVRVQVAPSLLEWALQRSRRDPRDLAEQFPKIEDWRSGRINPTLKQLERYATWTRTPIGQLLLDAPPAEVVPIPDFRTGRDADAAEPSADLLDVIYICQRRQDWYRQHALATAQPRIDFVGSSGIRDDVIATAAAIRDRLDFGLDSRAGFRSWTEALRELINRTEDAGVLVMVSGVVGNNTKRPLDTEDFRGFALSDDLAPVIFINGTDYKAAQIFTLVHELAHLFLGQSAVSDVGLRDRQIDADVERWCNAVAGEVLVPGDSLITRFNPDVDLHEELSRLAGMYRVSSLVVLRRLRDTARISWDQHDAAFEEQLSRVTKPKPDSSGNFYNTQPARASKRFTRALIADTLEGGTLQRDAFRLLGIKKPEAFAALGEHLGVS